MWAPGPGDLGAAAVGVHQVQTRGCPRTGRLPRLSGHSPIESELLMHIVINCIHINI